MSSPLLRQRPPHSVLTLLRAQSRLSSTSASTNSSTPASTSIPSQSETSSSVSSDPVSIPPSTSNPPEFASTGLRIRHFNAPPLSDKRIWREGDSWLRLDLKDELPVVREVKARKTLQGETKAEPIAKGLKKMRFAERRRRRETADNPTLRDTGTKENPIRMISSPVTGVAYAAYAQRLHHQRMAGNPVARIRVFKDWKSGDAMPVNVEAPTSTRSFSTAAPRLASNAKSKSNPNIETSSSGHEGNNVTGGLGSALREKQKKTLAELDEELKVKLESVSGGGGEAGLELEGGVPVAMKRGVRENMFRLI